MRLAFLPLAMVALLAACTTPTQRAAALAAETEQMMQLYGPSCDRLGYTSQSDAWRSCVLQMNILDNTRYGYPNYSYYPYGGGWYGW